MPANIHLHNVDDALVAKAKAKVAREHKSLSAYVLHLIEADVEAREAADATWWETWVRALPAPDLPDGVTSDAVRHVRESEFGE